MERRKAGRAGAQGRAGGSNLGPPSSSCESPWEGGQGTPVGGGDFFAHMDENGIIGLAEVSAGEELEEDGSEEGGVDLPWDPGALDPEDGPTEEDLLGDLSCGFSELQDSESLSQSPVHSLYEEDEEHVVMEDWGTEGNEEEDDDGEEGAASWALHKREAQKLPERDRQLDMTDEEREGEDGDNRGRSDPPFLTGVGTRNKRQGRDAPCRGRVRDGDSSGELFTGHFTGVSSPREREDDGRGLPEDSLPYQALSQNLDMPKGAGWSAAAHMRAPCLLHPPAFSGEQPDPEAGIQDETLPEFGFTESLPGSQSSRMSRAVRPLPEPLAEESLSASLALVGGLEVEEDEGVVGKRGMEEKQEISPRPLPLPRQAPPPAPAPAPRRKKTPSMHLSSHKAQTPLPEPSPLRTLDPGVRWGHKAPRASTPKSAGCLDPDHYRKGQLNFPLPDFSKVEPRVRIPRGEGYRPPKSKGPALQGASGVTEPLLVYKSPADIVREVLMSSGDSPVPRSPPLAAPAPSLSSRHERPVDTAVPQEFRSPEQASSLVHQLQEDYNKLLTKYAEAENTIDRLRLEAKVGLYSDPPKPSHSVQSGTIQKGSKVITLTFPQPQRAEFSQNAVKLNPKKFETSCAERSSSPTLCPQEGEQLTEDLANLAEMFQAQLDSFEDLLKSQKLKPFEEMKGLANLVQGQDSLERGYLRARDEHRSLQQRGREPPPFDPDREVDGKIFRLGMCLEELREQVEQTIQDHRGSMTPPSPLVSPDPCSRPLGVGGPTPHPESPVSPARGGFGGTVGAEVSSVSGESEVEDHRDLGEGLPSGLPPSLLCKQHRVERDFDTLMDHYQSFRELPGLLAEKTTEADSAMLHTASLGHHGIAPGLQRTDSNEGQRTVTPIQPERSEKDTLLAPPPEDTVDHLNGGFSLQEPLPLPLPLHGQPGSTVRQGSRKSHSSSLASLGGSTVFEPQVTKLHSRRSTAPPLDGLLSPETDSGFLGSESSQLMPAAGRLSHQGTRVSRSASPGERGKPPQPISEVSESARCPAPRRPVPQECVPGAPRLGQGSRGARSLPPESASASSSPQPWPSSLSGGSEPESEHTHSLSEGKGVRGIDYTRLANGQRSPSPATPRHHGAPLRALGSSQLTNRQEAIQSLQAEVTRLKQRLEDSLRDPNSPSHIRSPPSASKEAGQLHSIHPDPSRGREESEGTKRVWEKEVQRRKRDSPRPTSRKRSASVPQRRPELDISTDSEIAQSASKAQSSRRIPEANSTPGQQRQACSEAVMHRGPYTRQLYRQTPPGGGEENDNGNQNSGSRTCPYCRNGKLSSGGATDSVHMVPHSWCSQCCPRCRGSERHRGQGQVTQPGVSTLRDNQPVDSAQKFGGVFLAAAPPPQVQSSVPVVPCVSVCPSALYVSSPVLKARPSYTQPLYLSLDGGAGSAAARSPGRDRRHARSFSADSRALGRSLTRAIEAARGVRAASKSVARSLASGLHQQGLLTQSYLC